jgi:hypothetical protein
MGASTLPLNLTWSAYSADLLAIMWALAYKTLLASGDALMVMRAAVVILIAIGVIFYAHSNAPSEIQMRDAFQHYLADQTARTVEFIRQTSGPSAIERIKAAGNDQFEISAFRKHECKQSRGNTGFDCTFNVNIDLANGMMRRALEGRFYNTSTGIAFKLVEQPIRTSIAGR